MTQPEVPRPRYSPTPPVCAFATGNDAYIPNAVVSLLSIREHNPDFDLFILTTEVSSANARLCEQVGVAVVEIDLRANFDVPNLPFHWTKAVDPVRVVP